MKKLDRISDFAKAGLNTDLMPWDLPGDFLTDMTNIRVVDGRLEPFGDQSDWADLPASYTPGFLMAVKSNLAATSYWIIPCEEGMLVFDGGTFHDISNPEGYAGVQDVDFWNGCMLSNIPVMNAPGTYPEYWPQQSSGINMLDLPYDSTQSWREAGESAFLIRSHKQYLFALNLQSGAQEIPDGVRWSAPADIGGVPPTWDHLDTTNVAGLTTLGSDGGAIIDGLSLRDAFVVYREKSISVFDYIGGQFVWRIRHFGNAYGLISPSCIAEVKGRHYFIGDGDILVNDGNSIESIIHKRIKKRFASSYDSDNFRKSYVVKHDSADEIWFCIPESGNSEPNLAYIYNYEDDTWTIREIPNGSHAAYGPISTPPVTWDSIEGSWEQASSSWDQRQASPSDDSIVQCIKAEITESVSKLVVLGRRAGVPTKPYSAVAERIGYALEGLDIATTITRIYPHARGPGKFYIRVGSQDYTGAPIKWKPARLFDPLTERKFDVRSTGTLHCFKIYSVNDTVRWEVSGIDIEYSVGGNR